MIKRKIQVLRPLWEKSSPPQRYLFQDSYHWAIPSLWEQLRESTYFDLSNWYIRALWVDMIEAKCGSKSFAGYQNQFCASYLTTFFCTLVLCPINEKNCTPGENDSSEACKSLYPYGRGGEMATSRDWRDKWGALCLLCNLLLQWHANDSFKFTDGCRPIGVGWVLSFVRKQGKGSQIIA